MPSKVSQTGDNDDESDMIEIRTVKGHTMKVSKWKSLGDIRTAVWQNFHGAGNFGVDTEKEKEYTMNVPLVVVLDRKKLGTLKSSDNELEMTIIQGKYGWESGFSIQFPMNTRKQGGGKRGVSTSVSFKRTASLSCDVLICERPIA